MLVLFPGPVDIQKEAEGCGGLAIESLAKLRVRRVHEALCGVAN